MSGHPLVRSRRQSSDSWAPRRPSVRAQQAPSGTRYHSMTGATNPERERLEEANAQRLPWRKWGPYVSERQWGTVREDYSADGDAWNYFPHEHARSRAYRWGEDGIGGISDQLQRLCFAFAFWNERDPILKERLFGLTGPQGNHG